MELISIIIPTYNSEAFLDKALESVFSQTYTNWELWIIDDASTDTTVSIINKWQEKDDRIHSIVLPTNSGSPARSINEGVRNASGNYIAILEHDDWWHKEKLEQQLKVFKEDVSGRLGCVTSDVEMVYTEFNRKTIYRMKKYQQKQLLQELFSGAFFFSFSIPLIKKDVFLATGVVDGRFSIAADQDFFIRLAARTYFGHVARPLVSYNVHNKNLSSNQNKSNYIKQINDWLLLLEKQKEKYVVYKNAYADKLGQIAFLYGLLGDRKKSWVYFKKAFSVQLCNSKVLVKFIGILFFGKYMSYFFTFFNKIRFL